MRLSKSVYGFLAGLLSLPVLGCTIFVLTDSTRTLFFNNEDWSNPKTRIWFIPASKEYYGCAYVGFDDGWAQGGLNTEGLAFDWVAGFNDEWKAAPGMQKVRGNSSQRMLETCSTVAQAIEFYRTHLEREFARARILIADRSGASVIIGYKDGKLHIDESRQSRGFGYGWETLKTELAAPPLPTVSNGLGILGKCRQEGAYATKYSNVFDLRRGEIFLFLPGNDGEVKLALDAELAKGGHFYDLHKIRGQLRQDLKPLSNDMKRLFMDEYKALPDQEPEITKQVRTMLQQAIRGQLQPDNFTADLWKELSPTQEQVQADLKKLGELEKLTLVERASEGDTRSYRYRVDFKDAAVLQLFVFNPDGKLAASKSEGTEWK